MTQKLRLDLDQESFDRLAAIAIEERSNCLGCQGALYIF
jgi:hypothetical protein